MSLTDQIYAELVDGLEKGLDWTAFIAKHNAHKPELYDAIGRFLNDMGPKVKALGEVQAKLGEAELKLDSVDQRTKEAESNIAALEGRENALNKEVEAVETKLAERSELASHLAELTKLGFNVERLSQLKGTLTEIGAKHGLKGKEAVGKFFDDLKDYEAVLGAESQLKGLQTQIETKKLEAENWQAKEEALRRRHDDLKETIGAMHTLRTRGMKAGQIITWARILDRFGTVEQFEEYLAQYADVTKLLNARKEEAGSYELRVTKAQSQLETLEKEKARIEGAIEALRVAGLKELKAMTEATEKQLKGVAASEIKEIQAVGQSAKSQLDDYLTELNIVTERAYQLGEKIGQMRMHLEKYEAVRDILESHAVASETAK
ncbi:hypothetical protein ES704_02728 [subsurface metagenome]|jgi:chromosome segregation ATPase